MDAFIGLGITKTDPVSKDLVVTEQAKAGEHLNMGYIRLSPFSPQARQTIREIYQDLAKSASFNGILFHDDVTLSDYEDASPDALKLMRNKAYQQIWQKSVKTIKICKMDCI